MPNQFATNVEESGGLDKIEKLQYNPSREVYDKAYHIVEKYFSAGNEDQALIPEVAKYDFSYSKRLSHIINATLSK